MRVINPLTDKEVKSIRAEGTTAIGGAIGLYLQIVRGHRYFVFRYKNADGKTSHFSLGNADRLPLIKARKMAQECAEGIEQGIYPKELRERKRKALKEQAEQRKAEKERAANTFRKVSDTYLEDMERSGFWTRNPKGEANAIQKLRIHILPVIGDIPIDSLNAQNVFNVLAPIYQTKPATSDKVLYLIGDIWRYAKARGLITHRDENPTDKKGSLGILLRPLRVRRRETHFPALPYDAIPSFIEALHRKDGRAARALEFAILTASRSKMVRYLRWQDIDFANRIATIPEDNLKTKGRGQHTIFLSTQAIALLQSIEPIAGVEFVFASIYTLQPFSDAALGSVIRDMHAEKVALDGIGWTDEKTGAIATAHGTARATFKTWARSGSNRKILDDEAVELCLAHKLRDDYNGAYNRATLESERRIVMQAWSDFCYGKIESLAHV